MGRPFGTAENLTGRVFGRYTVLSRNGAYKNGTPLWRCECACGAIKNVTSFSLKKGIVKSCGCFHKEKQSERLYKHGMCGTKTYRCWSNMIQRCTNPKNHHYYLYGKRGISVCERWTVFNNFFEDMGKCPENLTLDRKNNNKGYDKNNCHWATDSEQRANRGPYRKSKK